MPALGFAAWPARPRRRSRLRPATPRRTTRRRSRSGATIFTDYTYTKNPTARMPTATSSTPNAFNVGRGYINITGNISHMVAFRITPDITRENRRRQLARTAASMFRLKYAFAQFNLDDWMTKGSGSRVRHAADAATSTSSKASTATASRARRSSSAKASIDSSDTGASFHYNLPKNYGDIHVGIYNGEGYTKPEANNQKAVQIRGTMRPFATGDPVLRGIRVTGFYDGDNYIKNGERNRVHRQRHLRAQVRQRRVRLSRRQGSDAAMRRRRRQGGRAASRSGSRRRSTTGLRRPVPLRPLQAEPATSIRRAQAHDRRRRLLVPAPGRRVPRR